jgi:hypothetical protein
LLDFGLMVIAAFGGKTEEVLGGRRTTLGA